jgi:hypothetical protein
VNQKLIGIDFLVYLLSRVSMELKILKLIFVLLIVWNNLIYVPFVALVITFIALLKQIIHLYGSLIYNKYNFL